MAPEPKFDFTPYDCTPGDTWEKFDQDLLIHCSGETDDRGWSLADYLLAQDEGSVGGPVLPPNNAAGEVASAAPSPEYFLNLMWLV